jgi:hypothetical protein
MVCTILATTSNGCSRGREASRPDLFADDRRLFLVVEKILGLDE